MRVAPCKDCADRIMPSLDNPASCKTDCQKYAAYRRAKDEEAMTERGFKKKENDFFTVRKGHIRQRVR